MAKNMSFLPEDYLQKRIARRTNILCMSLFVIVMGGVIAAFFVTDRQRSEIKRHQEEVNRQFVEAAKRLDQLDKLQDQKQQMIRKAKLASVLIERVPRTLLMSELINHMPATLSLLEFNLETKVIQSTPVRSAMQRASRRADRLKEGTKEEVQAPVTRMTIRMKGVAPTDVEIAHFVTALDGHALFSNPAWEYSKTTKIDGQEMREFAIELTVEQDVDLQTLQPTMVKRDLKMNPMGHTVELSGTVGGASVLPAGDRH